MPDPAKPAEPTTPAPPAPVAPPAAKPEPPARPADPAAGKPDRAARAKAADDAARKADEAKAHADAAEADAALKAHEAGRTPGTGPLVNPGPPKDDGTGVPRERKAYRVAVAGLGLWTKGHEFDEADLPEGADLDSLLRLGAAEKVERD